MERTAIDYRVEIARENSIGRAKLGSIVGVGGNVRSARAHAHTRARPIDRTIDRGAILSSIELPLARLPIVSSILTARRTAGDESRYRALTVVRGALVHHLARARTVRTNDPRQSFCPACARRGRDRVAAANP